MHFSLLVGNQLSFFCFFAFVGWLDHCHFLFPSLPHRVHRKSHSRHIQFASVFFPPFAPSRYSTHLPHSQQHGWSDSSGFAPGGVGEAGLCLLRLWNTPDASSGGGRRPHLYLWLYRTNSRFSASGRIADSGLTNLAGTAQLGCTQFCELSLLHGDPTVTH